MLKGRRGGKKQKDQNQWKKEKIPTWETGIVAWGLSGVGPHWITSSPEMQIEKCKSRWVSAWW